MGARDPLEAARDLLADGAASRAVRLLQVERRRTATPSVGLRLLLARALIAEGRSADAAPIAEGLLRLPIPEPATEALALAIVAHVRSETGDWEGAVGLADRALRLAAANWDEEARRAARVSHEVLSRAALFRGELGGAVVAAERASATAADLEATEREAAALHEAYVRMQADQFVAAREVLASFPAGNPASLTLAEAHRRLTRGAIEFHAGNWSTASALLDSRSLRAAGIDIGDTHWGISAGLLAVIQVHADRLDEASTLLAEATPPLATGPRPWLLWGALLLAEVRGEEAAMHSLVDRLLATILDMQSPLRLRVVGPDLVRLLRRLDRRAEATAITEQLETLAPGSGVGSVVAAADLCRGLLDDDRESLRRAADGFRSAGRPLEEAMALEGLAVLDLRLDQAEARDAGRRALALYDTLGARRDERRFGRTLRDAGVATGRTGRRSGLAVGWNALTASERAVAGLVAEGLTNAEIGARLAISTRTVESHVSHVLNKLSLPGRAAIAAAATRAAAERRQAG